MTEAYDRYRILVADAWECIENFRVTEHDFALRHVWVSCVSALDLYLTELVAEAGLRIVDKSPLSLTPNLRNIGIPLEGVFEYEKMSPSQKLIFFRSAIYSSVQFVSLYRSDGVLSALSYIWIADPKKKWKTITARIKNFGQYIDYTEQDIRSELDAIGDRRDLISHSVDWPPGADRRNPVRIEDAMQVIDFVSALVRAIDVETEEQINNI
ncbi:MAG: hypothetical protein LAT81_16625 [Oceanicaulis sp.]|nr:hypothetical protein [Oceanicaulis sp.]